MAEAVRANARACYSQASWEQQLDATKPTIVFAEVRNPSFQEYRCL